MHDSLISAQAAVSLSVGSCALAGLADRRQTASHSVPVRNRQEFRQSGFPGSAAGMGCLFSIGRPEINEGRMILAPQSFVVLKPISPDGPDESHSRPACEAL